MAKYKLRFVNADSESEFIGDLETDIKPRKGGKYTVADKQYTAESAEIVDDKSEPIEVHVWVEKPSQGYPRIRVNRG
jgi:hypothetical protein